MGDLDALLKSLPEHGGRRVAAILAWMLPNMSLDGVALLVASEPPSEILSVWDSRGSLAAMAPLLAAEWARTGIPREAGLVSLPLGGDAADFFYCLPLRPGSDGGILVLHGHGVQEAARTRMEDLSILGEQIRNALEQERTARGGKGAAASSAAPAEIHSASRLPGLPLLTEGLRLPLYICDTAGQFQYASPAFLELTGHPSLEALCLRGNLFLDMKARLNELDMIRSTGKVAAFPLSIMSGSGNKLEIRDSAVALEDSILGVFFDVTALMAANAELKDTLQIQELLNDSILTASRNLQRTQGAAIRTLARLAEYRDQETGFHLQRICEYTRLLAVQVQEREPYAFRITREYGDDISLSSMLHDIGKVSIPDSVLLKPGKLDSQEWDVMKKHTYFGWEVLHKADKELGEQSFLTLAATIALAHHERYDGKGYPNGTVGEQIPLSARICAVADVYDALTSARPYKPAWSHEQALEEVLRQGGTQFDPVLIEIMRDINAQFADVRRQWPE